MKEIIIKNKALILCYLVIGILNAFMTNYKADYFQNVIDGFTDGNLALKSILVYGFILILNYCMEYVDGYPGKKLEYGIFLDFKLLALRKISAIDYMEYQKTGTGKLVQQIETGAGAGRDVIYSFWLCLLRQLIPTILFCIYFIWKINQTVTYFLLAGYVVTFIITNVLLKFLYRIKERILDHEEQLNHFLVRGFMEMLVFRMERQFSGEIKKAAGAKAVIVSSKVKMNMIHEAFFTIFALLVAVLDVGILCYAWMGGGLSVGSVVALISLIQNAYAPIAIFNVLYVQYKLDKASFSRFEEFLKKKDDDRLDKGIIPDAVTGAIDVKGLSFRYEGHKVLDDIFLTVRKGEKIAFVGESGSGKSTLAKLIMGLLKYEKGRIILDGMELKDICLNELYRNICYIPQEAPVFDGTIKENLAFDRDVPEEQLIEALTQVRLLPLIESSEKGLHTEIGEHGTCLSGGEKQRLALARLWFTEAGIVILDEATSAMDNMTEKMVMKEVLERQKERTVIAIAHRLSSVIDFDRIVVLKEGKIVEQGTFGELMCRDAYFAQLYKASV